VLPSPTPPERSAVCRHDIRGHLRQACCCCGACDHIDYRVTDAAWSAVVPAELTRAHVCLRCFDALAAETGWDYAADLQVVWFVGDRASVELVPVSAVSIVR
jgi:hypothetical protein